jgi:prepilin-type N-terminal cleavage/methylation domain-containing protein
VHSKSAASHAGFSLVELVIVVSIMAVIAAIAVPRFADASSGRRLQAAKSAILHDIERAKLRARATSTDHILQFYPDRETYIITEGDTVSADAIILARNLSEDPLNIQIQATNLSGDNNATITPYGDLTPSVRIRITDGSNYINVDLPGITITRTPPVVEVTESDVDDLGLIGGLLDALGL